MKVFISWSGPQSKAVAELLKRWLKRVLQATEPWVSTEDIEKGTIWFTEIGNQLKDTAVGIICLTSENLHAPWILFEAGALAKGLSQNRVCTFLVGITDRDLTPPLSQFNATNAAARDDLFKLIQTINRQLGEKSLDDATLGDSFDAFWPKFEAELKQAIADAPASKKAKKRPAEEILDEVLQTTRDIQRHLQTQASGVANSSILDQLSRTRVRALGIPSISEALAATEANQIVITPSLASLFSKTPLSDGLKDPPPDQSSS